MEFSVDFKVREIVSYNGKGQFEGDLDDLIEVVGDNGESYWIDDDYSVYNSDKKCIGHLNLKGELVFH